MYTVSFRGRDLSTGDADSYKGAANRFPDKCNNDPEGTRALNITASASLAKLCAANSIILIYISTDYVFPGTEGDAPYQTNSTPKPPNLYGETKLEGEKAVLSEFEKAGKAGWGVVLRVPVLYGEAETPSESAVNVLMEAVQKAQDADANIKVDHWSIRYPTNTEDVGRVCQGRSLPQISGYLLIFDRPGYKVSRDRRQIHPPQDPPILLRRQVYEI